MSQVSLAVRKQSTHKPGTQSPQRRRVSHGGGGDGGTAAPEGLPLGAEELLVDACELVPPAQTGTSSAGYQALSVIEPLLSS